MKKQDSIFFERGFNRCDLEYLEKIIAKDLKFYHDQSGFQNKKLFFENTRKYICPDSDKKPIRKLQEGSLKVFPLYNNGELYGAIQKGTHNFYIREKGKDDIWTSTAKFTSVWTKNKEEWILNEVLSYDHHKPNTKSKQLSAINQLLSDNKVPAMGIGILENGKLTKVQVYGSLDGEKTAPYNTIFKVASLTKPVFAFTVLTLIDKGLLGLDEPLYQYWIDPDIKNDERHKKLTPRIILSHQTGFPNWRYLKEPKKLEFQFDPGTKYQYSGEGFEYLRKAIEHKFNKKIEELTNEYVFKPAKMTDTRFWWDTTMDETRYAQNFDNKGNKIPTKKYYKANSAANLLTTVEDYGRFMEYVINDTSLSKNIFGEMIKHQVKLEDNSYFGLGWQILTNFSKNEYGLIHTGKDPGVSTLAIIFPKSKNGYLIFLNGDNVDKVYENILSKELYLGLELWNMR
ncbi:class A beta-lactamase-related serine hydrolase [Aquimarina mytili]|uniref:class A beta-lactamase-related serine hydrolase n=1 Tax=Aquimarina mytili TaxID=874423 RepID=UPI001F190394|nr:class A beta-lactamase-related serine hydrolase [Aquimarina mytili]